MHQPGAHDQWDVERRDPEELDAPPGLVGERLPRQSLPLGCGPLDFHRLVGQDRQRDDGEGRRDHERHAPVDAGALQHASQEEGGGHAEGEAGAEQAEHLHPAHHARVGRHEDGRQPEGEAGEDATGRQHPDGVPGREDHVAGDREDATGPDPGEHPDAPRQRRPEQAAARRAGEEEGAGQQPDLPEADVEVTGQRPDHGADVAAVPPGDRQSEDEYADAPAGGHSVAFYRRCRIAGGDARRQRPASATSKARRGGG